PPPVGATDTAEEGGDRRPRRHQFGILTHVPGINQHRAIVDEALKALGKDWDAWPGVLTASRLDPSTRLSGVLVLLAAVETFAARPQIVTIDPSDETLDWLGRAREPWASVARMRLPWTTTTATTAVWAVTNRGLYDDRRIAIALRGARQICSEGKADIGLLDALAECVAYLQAIERTARWEPQLRELLSLATRVITSATPPEILDLSMLVDGDTWADPAREAARSLPAEDIAPLVRLLSDLGPRRPPQRWLRDVETTLNPPSARQLLHRWTELASAADIVPEWPGSIVGDCRGTLFVGSNADIVRAAVWATSVLRDESWPVEHLVVLARRGELHNGAPQLPEPLALKVAAAAVDALAARGTPADRIALVGLLTALRRRDLTKKVTNALGGSPT
uniref:hypothetical protein n=1 Tax=Nocardioides sp. Iso805N TaxID=1283287 RepID=UPI001E431A39